MAKYLDKTQVSIDANPVHGFPMQPMHLTTSRFMHFDIAFAKEFPKAKIPVNHKTFIRTMPLKKPLLSSVSFHKSGYFVPFRTVWEPFTDFKEETPHQLEKGGVAIFEHVPLLANDILISTFLKPANGFVDTSFTGPADFVTNRQEDDQILNDVYGRFTSKGKDAFKLLCSLGYRIYWDKYLVSEGDETSPDYKTTSALPLLCAAKVYLDYFFPNQYSHTGYYINLDGIFKRQSIYTLSEQDLKSIFEACRFVSYNSDYFVSSFDSPLGPSAGVVSQNYSIFDVSSLGIGGSAITPNTALNVENDIYTGIPSIQNSTLDGTVLTQYMDNALKRLNSYIMRHGLAGSRSLERYLADWGVALSADKLQRCYKLGEKHYPLEVADIVSNADTIQEVAGELTGAALGDLAGKGVAFNGEFKFNSEFDEFGYLIVVNTIVPEVSYFQGIDRNVLHKTRLDFLTGSFDGLGNRPCTSEELFVGMLRHSDDYDGIFSFVPIYSEYKTAVDRITGDFLLNSVNTGLEGWSTMREFSDTDTDEPFSLQHSLDFVLGQDYEIYNRIFLDSNDDSDKFVVLHRAELDANMPAVPLYDYYDFEDGKKKIELAVNGSKSN